MGLSADIYRPGQPARAPSVSTPGNWVFGTGDCFTDDFESYSAGNLCDQSDWEGWEGSGDVCGLVSTEQAFCGTNSLKIIGDTGAPNGADQVHRFNDANGDPIRGGVWTFSVMTFIPNDAQGDAYIIMLAEYPAPFNWAMQVHLDVPNGVVQADCGGNETIPIITGRWVEFRAEIDLPNDLVDYFYDGVEFVTDTSWTNRVGTPNGKTIQALDLYANEPGSGTTGTYFDNVSLTSVEACPSDCDPCDMNCDGTINAFDIEPFLGLLFDGDTPCDTCTGDANNDGNIDAFDIHPFLNCLFP